MNTLDTSCKPEACLSARRNREKINTMPPCKREVFSNILYYAHLCDSLEIYNKQIDSCDSVNIIVFGVNI